MVEFQAGQVLAQRYRLSRLLGQGGMGSVWRADHLTLGSEVAVKLIDPEIGKNPEARARFVREAQAAAALRSPHVVQVLDYGMEGEVPFIVMELMIGESLAERLQRVGQLAPEQTSRIMTDVARALAKAHDAGIVHRDLKPDNIFLVENDDVEVAKVLDFGVARVTAYSADSASMTSTGAVLGTPFYMSPEQAEGLKQLDHRTDIWAMAVITFECLVGQKPFGGETLGGVFLAICARDIVVPSSLAAVPVGFDEWFKKGTNRVVEERFEDARQAARTLKEVCRGASDPLDESATGITGGSLAASGLPPADSVFGGESGASQLDLSAAKSGSVPGLANTAIGLPTRKGVSSLVWIALGLCLALVVGVVLLLPPSPDEEALTGQADEASLVAQEEESRAAAVVSPPLDEPEQLSVPTVSPRSDDEPILPPAPPPAPKVAPATEPQPAAPAPRPSKPAPAPSKPAPRPSKPAPRPSKPAPRPPSTPARPSPVDLGI